MTPDKIDLPALEGGAPSRFLVFGSPLIEEDEIKEVVDSLRSGWIGTGPKTVKFEKLIGEFVGSKYSIALNSCTAGLHLSLISCGITSGDEVITSPMTFAATANVIEHVGAKPVFVDIELDTMNIDPLEIEKKITKKTKAIIPVHFAGRPCNMESVMAIAKKYKLKIIEDAAHAFGASYHGKPIGTIGDTTVFSFYVTKNLITGEGGLVSTNDPKLADSIRLYSLHGLSKDAWKRYSDEGFKHYLIEVPGYKYNMMDIQAAIGIHQLAKFEKGQKIRENIWQEYNAAFEGLPLFTPLDPEADTVHARHLYTILLDLKNLKADRETIQAALHAEGIGIGVHFISLHLHPFYAHKYGYKRGDFPNAEYISDRTISLPFSAKLTHTDVQDVKKAVIKVFKYYQFNKPRPTKTHLPSAAQDTNGFVQSNLHNKKLAPFTKKPSTLVKSE
jgi:dTDP-4-amino-4,6-dideoxygalactose transaminase